MELPLSEKDEFWALRVPESLREVEQTIAKHYDKLIHDIAESSNEDATITGAIERLWNESFLNTKKG